MLRGVGRSGMFGLFSKALSYFWRRAGDEEGEDERWAAAGRSSWARCGFAVPDAEAVCRFRALRVLMVSSPT